MRIDGNSSISLDLVVGLVTIIAGGIWATAFWVSATNNELKSLKQDMKLVKTALHIPTTNGEAEASSSILFDEAFGKDLKNDNCKRLPDDVRFGHPHQR